MIRLLLVKVCLLLALFSSASTIVVTNPDELKSANKNAGPGDTVVLQNGEWRDVSIKLDCHGKPNQPILFRAQTPGQVRITGHSQLRIGGEYIIVEGLNFVNGYAGSDAVITFSTGKDKVANYCRVTNTVINDFNNPKRMEENYWVAFYGKHNQVDHCSFTDKKNMGVLMAVILDDDRSRENFHSIDHNYFGRRLPLASNSGEIIRVGVSQHCEFNSNTRITDNFFEHCDGETEIISIKSCSNLVQNNLFKECQGGVVLRHGNYNTVENNIFLGNGKAGTGGVRVINKGQWVVNNFFYQCRGVDFRSPLSVMNGIPNSPANRYVQVTDAVIANNTWVDCTPVSFCEGSDTERTLPPSNVALINNIFYNTHDADIYKVYDDTKGFRFAGNEISTAVKQDVNTGFRRAAFTSQKNGNIVLPVTLTKGAVALPDSLQQKAAERLGHPLSTKPGFANMQLIKDLQAIAYSATGAKWFNPANKTPNLVVMKCGSSGELYKQLQNDSPVKIMLTGKEYSFDRPLVISKPVVISTTQKANILFNTEKMLALFVIEGNGSLSLESLSVTGDGVKATHFIASSKEGRSDHYNLSVRNCRVSGLLWANDCRTIFYAYKYMVADSIVFRNNQFINNQCALVIMNEEKDNKGYYNAEKIIITNNRFVSCTGQILDVYRGGNDESTMGPDLLFSMNQLDQCSTDYEPLIKLYGVQRSRIEKNQFRDCNHAVLRLIEYTDMVRASHIFRSNKLTNSGGVYGNKFVEQKDNEIR